MTTLSATVACLYQKFLREYGQIDIDSSAYTCFLLDYHSHALAKIVKAYVNKKKSSSTTRLSNHDNYWKETTMTFISNHKQKIISSYISATVSSHPELEKHPTLPLVYQKKLQSSSGSNIVGWRFRTRTCAYWICGRRNAFRCYLWTIIYSSDKN